MATSKAQSIQEVSLEGNETRRLTIVLHSGDMDKMYSTLILGTGALSMGMEASIYFTFWGLERIKKGGLDGGPLSKMNFVRLGKKFMKRRMKKANVAPLERLMADFKDLGGKIIACDMTMGIMGISKKEMNETIIDEYGAVGTYLNESKGAEITLFI